MDALALIQKRGACKDAPDPSIFFPGDGERDKTKQARKFCAHCEVVDVCLQYAIENNECGTWGNTTEFERSRASGRQQLRVAS